MAIYHCTTKPISRSKGRSAVAAAAYRAGERIEDTRTGITHDYTKRQGVVATLALLPDGERCERSELWNAAELAETRKNSRTAREWVIALPDELESHQRLRLTTDFATELSQRYGVAVDLAIHAPDQSGDQRNHHAHILTTTRTVEQQAGQIVLGGKATLELSDTKRGELKLEKSKTEIKQVRAWWAERANEYLEREGHEVRIDHRSLKEQGIDRVASIHLGPVATDMERNGRASDRGNINRDTQQLEAEIIDLKAERRRKAERDRQLWIQRHPDKVVEEYHRYYDAIRHQIGQRAESMYDQAIGEKEQLRYKHYQHLQAEPPEPKGLLAPFRKKPYERWRQEKHRMENRLHKLRQRSEWAKDYLADGNLTPYRHKGNDLAYQQMKEQHPDLAKDKEIADDIIMKQRKAQLERELVERERRRRRSRYRGRGLER